MRKSFSKRYVGSLLAGWGLMCASLCYVGTAGAQDTCPPSSDPSTCHDFAYVTDWSGDQVHVVDINAPVGHAYQMSIPVGGSPVQIKASPTGDRMYVANNGSNSVSVISTALNQKIADIAVGDGPQGLAAIGTRVYVANTTSSTVSVIDKDQLAVVATIGVGNAPGQIAANPSTNTIYVTNRGSGTVSVIDCGSNRVTASLNAGRFPWGVALTPDGSMLSVTNLSDSTLGWISAGGGSMYGSGTVGIAPYSVLIHPSSYTVYVANADDGTVSLLWGSWLWQTINTWQTISTTTIQTGAEWGPYDVALTFDGTRLLVPTFSGGTLNVYDSNSGQQVRQPHLAGTPRGVASIRRAPIGS
jgi:YVTN family beta-propeller protein